MAKFKVYAVRRGRQTGIFTTWAECEAQVKGYNGAVFKGFLTAAEAQAWLWGKGAAVSDGAPAVSAQESAANGRQQETLFVLPAQKFDYIVYTDGSCLRNPDGPGGYAAVLLCESSGESTELSGGEPATTNNRMELTAALMALRALPPGVRIQLNTDSRYLRDAIEKYWLRSWKKRGWITSVGTAVKNRDLWEALDAELEKRRGRIVFCWVKGHAGQKYNERCDVLAKGEAMKYARRG